MATNSNRSGNGLHLTAIFEEWLLGDGVYPLLHCGQRIRVAFELQQDTLTAAGAEEADHFTHKGGGAYDFVGRVLWATGDRTRRPIIAIEATSFRFYCSLPQHSSYPTGIRLVGSGLLCLDHGMWTERIVPQPSTPDLFWALVITRIQKVTIPEVFITRSSGGESYPTALPPWQYPATVPEDIATMTRPNHGAIFFLIECNSAGLETAEIPLTFID